MQTISPPETTQQQRLKRGIKNLIHQHLQDTINPYWLVSFHYSDNKTQEQEVLQDTQDLKRKLQRIIYKSRDKSIKGAGPFPYPKLLFFHEISHQGTGQYHTHLIAEAFPTARCQATSAFGPPLCIINCYQSLVSPDTLNTQAAVEHLFRKTLPSKVRALSKWKSIDIQRIHPDPADCQRISNYLSKQITPEHLTLDPFSSDLTPTYNRPRDAK